VGKTLQLISLREDENGMMDDTCSKALVLFVDNGNQVNVRITEGAHARESLILRFIRNKKYWVMADSKGTGGEKFDLRVQYTSDTEGPSSSNEIPNGDSPLKETSEETVLEWVMGELASSFDKMKTLFLNITLIPAKDSEVDNAKYFVSLLGFLRCIQGNTTTTPLPELAHEFLGQFVEQIENQKLRNYVLCTKSNG
jgi:hypothetical protein